MKIYVVQLLIDTGLFKFNTIACFPDDITVIQKQSCYHVLVTFVPNTISC
jgi:hypothetical protein